MPYKSPNTGTHAITSRHHDEPLYPHPLGEPQSLTFSLEAIKQLDGLYCLNDLHRLSGGEKKNTPSRFIHLDKTQALINALQDLETQKATQNPYMGSEHFSNMRTDSRNLKKGCGKVFRVVNGGEYHGIYGNRKIVYAYANWIDPYFYATVLEVFDRVFTAPLTLSETFNQKTADLKAVIDYLHECGSGLATHGKKTKPRLMRELKELLDHIQPQLPLVGGAV